MASLATNISNLQKEHGIPPEEAIRRILSHDSLAEFRTHVTGLMNSALTPAEAQSNWALGLAGETGEVIELIKKSLYHGKEFPRDRLVEELGGVLWYVQAIAIQNGISIVECFEYNIEQLRARHGGTVFNIDRVDYGKEPQ